MAIPPREQAIRTATRWCGVLVLGVIASIASAQPQWRLDPIGGWGGPVNHVQVEGDIAYVGSGQRLVVLDISDEANPTELGSIGLVKAVHDFVVRDGYAYVATESHGYGFCVVDVSQRESPQLVWYDEAGDIRSPREVDLRGSVAYVRDADDIEAFDVTDPENPMFQGRILGGPGGFYPSDIEIVGDLMHVAPMVEPEFGRGYYAIYDLGPDPLNPSLLGDALFHISREAHRVEVEGDWAYVLVDDRFNGRNETALWTVDISDPSDPIPVDRIVVVDRNDPDAARNPPRGLAVSGGFVYVAEWAGEPGSHTQRAWERARGLLIFDATDPENIVQVGDLKTHGTIRSLRADGDRLYLYDDGEGLIVADITDRADPQILGNYHSPAELRMMAKGGDLLYVADAWNGFTVLDVSDPARPGLVGAYQTPHAGRGVGMWGMELLDGLIYLNTVHDGLEIVDVSDPSAPTQVGQRWFPPEVTFTLGLDVSTELVPGRIVAIVGIGRPFPFPPALSFLDVTDPEQIQEIFRVESAGAVAVFDQLSITVGELPSGDAKLAFLGSGDRPVIFDASDLPDTAPFVVFEGGPEPSQNMEYADGFMYYARAADNGGLYIRDVNNPSEPGPPIYLPQGITAAVSLDSGRAYTAASSTINVYDVRNPTEPELLAELSRLPSYTHLLASEPYLFGAASRSRGMGFGPSADSRAGLLVLATACAADFTGSGDPGDPGYGVPDGVADADDFFYFLDQFAAGNTDVADLTGSSDPNDPGYGVPDGVIDADDFFYFLDLFVLGCP